MQWNLSPLGPKVIVLIYKVSFLQGENMYLYKVGTQSSVRLSKVSLFQRCPLREVPLYMWQPRVKIEHYSVVYVDRITVFKALLHRTSIEGGAHMQWVNLAHLHSTYKHHP